MLAAALCFLVAACGSQPASENRQFAYIGGAGVPLRDQLGPDSKVEMLLDSGARVEIVSTRPRWVEVKLENGMTGWVLERYIVSQQVFDDFQKLARESEHLPSQGTAVIRRTANLHLRPGRETETFYQLAEDEQAEVLAHAVAPLPNSGADAGGEPRNEDWLLVRGSRGRTGWLLESSVDMNPPLEVAQYREGLRIRAWFVLKREQVDGQEHAWYLWATSSRPAGSAGDFDSIRVFVWNPKMSRYETSWRERGLTGFLPITVETRPTPQGPTPAFRFVVQTADGARVERKYVMVARQVTLEREAGSGKSPSSAAVQTGAYLSPVHDNGDTKENL